MDWPESCASQLGIKKESRKIAKTPLNLISFGGGRKNGPKSI
jgi:hypothetical protein